MTKVNLTTMTNAELIERYTSALLQQYAFRDHHDSQGKRDVRPWNRLADQVEAVHRELKMRGDDGINSILPLIHHPNPKVSYAAAVHCLRQRTAEVLPVLKEKAQSNDWRDTKADFQGALEMWNEGKWVVD